MSAKTDNNQVPENTPTDSQPKSLRDQVRTAVIWRSGAQIAGQMITWGSTFFVIRILSPSDYGLYAMTAVILNLLSLVNGYGLANAVIQRKEITPQVLRQLFGMLILLNGTLATIQLVSAPYVASYYGQPEITGLLRVQALLYATNPFMALAYAVLSRKMEFKAQAQANLFSAVVGAMAALAGAMAGLGVWTLVIASIVGFATRALAMTVAANSWMLPSFNFSGALSLATFGGLMAAGQFFWFLQTQTDIFIAGRAFTAHGLGIYTTSLFLTQMFVTKFVPPINEIAFSAYAKVQDDPNAIAQGFLKSVRIIFLAGMPFCLGLAAVSRPLVPTVLGEQWIEAVPVVALLGFAMPLMTLQVLFGPAVNATGNPKIITRIHALGAVVMTIFYFIGVPYGPTGIATAWIAGYAVLVALSLPQILPILNVKLSDLAIALAPPALAGALMYVGVFALDQTMAPDVSILHLALLVLTGGAIYGLALVLFARGRISELIDLIRKRRGPEQQPA